jgi:hypothetical protein
LAAKGGFVIRKKTGRNFYVAQSLVGTRLVITVGSK